MILQALNTDPSPVQSIINHFPYQVSIKRDDLLYFEPDDPFCGNKWRKLKYNLQQAVNEGHDQLLTFGGSFSNHLAAVASAGAHFNFKTIGIVRGESISPLNATLSYCVNRGMQLHFLDRTTYRQKEQQEVIQNLQKKWGTSFLIPEGGTNHLAIEGCAELTSEIGSPPDYICVCCGTGGTMAGIIRGIQNKSKVVGISVLKGDFLKKDIAKLVNDPELNNWEVLTKYHFGGYAKFKPNLIEFINHFYATYQIPLDPVYTGKLCFAVWDLMENGYFKPGSHIMIIHTGGLQGIAGFNQRFGDLITWKGPKTKPLSR